MASVEDWSALAQHSSRANGEKAESYDRSMHAYYSIFVPGAIPPGFFYLSYASVTSGRPVPSPGADGYFYLAEFYRRIVHEFSHANKGTDLAGKDILATGTGLGGVGQILAETYPLAQRIVCIDLVTEQVEFARSQLSHLKCVEFEVGDVCSLTAADASYEVVFDEVVISHMRGEHSSKASEALQEFYRVLAPGGCAVLSGYARSNDLEEFLIKFREAGFEQLRCANLNAANAEGAELSLVHMFGRSAFRRMQIIVGVCSGPFKGKGYDEFLIEFGLEGKFVATCQSRSSTAGLFDRIYDHFHSADCKPSLLASLVDAKAMVMSDDMPDTVAAIPDGDIASYGIVLDALALGLITCMSRTSIGESYKACWVMVLRKPVASSAGTGDNFSSSEGMRHRCQVVGRSCQHHDRPVVASVGPEGLLVSQASSFGRAVRGCLNSAATLLVLALLRVGRATRWMRSHLGTRQAISFNAAPNVPHKVLEIQSGSLSEEMFVREYLSPRHPLVARNAVADWPAMWKWTPHFFARTFGQIIVKVQGNHFQSIKRLPLVDFLKQATRIGPHTMIVPCSLRYSLPRGVWLAETLRTFGMFGCLARIYGSSFTHAAFLELQSDWHPPHMLPSRGYTFPWTRFLAESPKDRFFYDWGVYIAPRGAVTRLHVDGQTNAVLMLVSGEKRGVLVPPFLSDLFVNAADAPPGEPLFEQSLAALRSDERARIEQHLVRFVVRAGDMIFIPRGWAHEVYTEELSIMVTYNFIHGLPDLACSILESIWKGYGGARIFRLNPA